MIEYTADRPCRLELRPLIAFRDYHATAHENAAINPGIKVQPELVRCSLYQGCPDLYFAHNGVEVRQTGDWYRNFEYFIEEERGLDELGSAVVQRIEYAVFVRS